MTYIMEVAWKRTTISSCVSTHNPLPSCEPLQYYSDFVIDLGFDPGSLSSLRRMRSHFETVHDPYLFSFWRAFEWPLWFQSPRVPCEPLAQSDIKWERYSKWKIYKAPIEMYIPHRLPVSALHENGFGCRTMYRKDPFKIVFLKGVWTGFV